MSSPRRPMTTRRDPDVDEVGMTTGVDALHFYGVRFLRVGCICGLIVQRRIAWRNLGINGRHDGFSCIDLHRTGVRYQTGPDEFLVPIGLS